LSTVGLITSSTPLGAVLFPLGDEAKIPHFLQKNFTVLVAILWNSRLPPGVSDRVSLTEAGTLGGCETAHIIQTDDANQRRSHRVVRDKKPWIIRDLSASRGRKTGSISPTTAGAPWNWC
jgi:hypothetical protein